LRQRGGGGRAVEAARRRRQLGGSEAGRRWQRSGCAQRDGGYYTLLLNQSYFGPQDDHIIQTDGLRK